jgi:hypothetical protein
VSVSTNDLFFADINIFPVKLKSVMALPPPVAVPSYDTTFDKSGCYVSNSLN